MKLYSKKQLSIAIVTSVLAGILIFFVGGLVLTPLFNKKNSTQQTSSLDLSKSQNNSSLQNTNTLAENIQNSKVSTSYSTDELENITIYEKLNEAVVNITTEELFYNWFSEAVPQEGQSGSGSIIDSQGYVLTNRHVVQDAFKVYVSLANGARYEAKVVGIDPENDLAVIKFKPDRNTNLNVVPFGESNNLHVGQKVLAIGNPFGLERTLTRGIISGIGRPISQSDKNNDGTTNNIVLQNMIQTDASINPGNSGGPLLDSKGKLIGVNTMIYSPSGGSVGIGFAVPVDTAKRVVPELIKFGKVSRGSIEVSLVPLFRDLIAYMKDNGLSTPVNSGLLISSVKKGGNADRAGLRGGTIQVRTRMTSFFVGGDIIVSVNGKDTSSLPEFYAALESTKPNDNIEIIYYHLGKKISTRINLVARSL